MRITLFVLICLSLWACQPSSGPTDSSHPDSSLSISEDISQQGAAYYDLSGHIGTYPIHMNILLRGDQSSRSKFISGNYFYDRYTAPIALYGNLTGDSLILFEENPAVNEPAGFYGHIEGDSIFVGSWQAADSERRLDFRLRIRMHKTGIDLVPHHFHDSLSVVSSNQEDAPKARYEAIWLAPRTDDIGLEAFLRKQIAIGLGGDSIGNALKQPDAVVDAAKNDFFQAYQEEIDEGIRDGWIDTSELDLRYSYEESVSMSTYFNDLQLLTFGYTHYYFTGGAHGNYGTTLQTLDLNTKKALGWSDVFSNQLDSSQLSSTLEQAAIQRYDLSDIEELRSMLFDDHIPPTDNFGLTQKGIIFVYSPYEIAPYAVGEIELFVPYKSIRDALKEEFILRLNSLLPDPEDL